MSFKVSSSIFTVPYVCLYNGAGGMCFYSVRISSVSALPLQTTLHCLSVVCRLCAQVFISDFGHRANWVSLYEFSSVTPACCCFLKLFLIVFRENHHDMSVGIVNTTQRKYYKDTLLLLCRKLSRNLSLREAVLYLSNPLTKEKCLLGNKVNKCD